MNPIPARQNEPRALRLLAAQRHVYSIAKRWFAWSIVAAVPIPVALSLASVFAPGLGVKPWAALWGISAALTNVLIVERIQKRLIRKGALIQETLDCELFDLEWNEVKAGTNVAPEDIAEAADAYLTRNGDKDLRDWYPTSVPSAALPAARAICQRANCAWEMRMRRKYATAIAILLALVIGGLLVPAIIAGLTFSDWLLIIIAPLAPAVMLGVRQIREHLAAADASERLSRHAEAHLREAVAGTDAQTLKAKARALQDEILDRRLSAPLLFDSIYNRFRDARDREMNQAAAELVGRIHANGEP